VGGLVRKGEALSPEDKAPVSGQVLFVERQAQAGDAAYAVTLRRGRAYLALKEGQKLSRTGAVVQQGDLLGTQDLVVPKTTDIVQGLPRIARLFEAQPEHLARRLDELWQSYRESLSDFEAAKAASRQMQRELVSEVQSAYLAQGVTINNRHIELVAAQMNGKCEILDNGGSQLKEGSIVDYRDLEAYLALRPAGDISVKPMVMGVTRVGKQSHVMVSMGFREINNIIMKDLSTGPTVHELSGIKENLMTGKAIHVGSSSSTAQRMWQAEGTPVNLGKVPEWGRTWPLDERVDSS